MNESCGLVLSAANDPYQRLVSVRGSDAHAPSSSIHSFINATDYITYTQPCVHARAQNRRIWPRNVRFTLTKMTIVNQTQLTPSCFGYDKAALSAPSLVGELSVTLRDLPHTLFGSLASNAAPIRYNLRIVTDIAIVGPRTLATAGA